MSDKALSNAALELTQKIQLHFPRSIDSSTVQFWNSCQKEVLVQRLVDAFGKIPTVPISEPKHLLNLLGTIDIPAMTERFVAKDWFTEKNPRVKIWGLGNQFQEWFLGKIEEPIRTTSLRYHVLRKSSGDISIVSELGGEEKAETTLAEMCTLVEKQGQGQEGILLVNGYANVFYIRDVNGVLRSVGADFGAGDGWYFSADPLEGPYEWRGGDQVFSRNS